MSKVPELVRGHELFRWGYSEGIQVGAVAGFVIGAGLVLTLACVALWGRG